MAGGDENKQSAGQGDNTLPPSYEEAIKSPTYVPPQPGHIAMPPPFPPPLSLRPEFSVPTPPPPFAHSSSPHPSSDHHQQQPPNQATSGIFIGQPTVVAVVQQSLGPHRMHLWCPQCDKTVKSRVSGSARCEAWLCCGLLSFFCFPFCCIPFLLGSCYEWEHKCPQCRSHLGTFIP